VGVGQGKHVQIWDPLFISATVEANNFKFDIQLGLGEYLAEKQLFDENCRGLGWRNIQKIMGPPPHLFLQPLKLATSNLVCNLGLGVAYQETTFRPKLAGVRAKGVSQKIWGPLFISATVEGSNFKFGIQLGLGE